MLRSFQCEGMVNVFITVEAESEEEAQKAELDEFLALA